MAAKKNLKFAYDKKADILDISIGEPQKAISREIEDDFFVRLYCKTGKAIIINGDTSQFTIPIFLPSPSPQNFSANSVHIPISHPFAIPAIFPFP